MPKLIVVRRLSPPLPEAMPAWIKVNCLLDKKLVNGLQKQERAMSGYDVKLSGQAPYLPWAKIKGTYYYWDASFDLQLLLLLLLPHQQ
jgi:hypothetical protein